MVKRRRSRELKNNQVIDIEAARRERRERRKLSAAEKAQKAKEPRREPSQRQVIKSMRRKIVYGLIFIVIGLIIGASAYNVIKLKIEEAEAQAKLDKLMAEKQALEEELALVDSEEYIEQQAREHLRMIMPGEILYVLKEREEEKDETAD
ncbi:MAG: FtsB family cell division protein [Anaerovoracaceae bacterium]